jgi:hypothetical protein
MYSDNISLFFQAGLRNISLNSLISPAEWLAQPMTLTESSANFPYLEFEKTIKNVCRKEHLAVRVMTFSGQQRPTNAAIVHGPQAARQRSPNLLTVMQRG